MFNQIEDAEFLQEIWLHFSYYDLNEMSGKVCDHLSGMMNRL